MFLEKVVLEQKIKEDLPESMISKIMMEVIIYYMIGKQLQFGMGKILKDMIMKIKKIFILKKEK